MSTQAIATAKEVFDLLRDDLSAIEKELVRDAVSNVGAITDIADHLREGGGKAGLERQRKLGRLPARENR